MADWPYGTARWRRLRKMQLQMYPLCEACLPTPKPANHVDHRKAINHGGEPFPPIGIGLASLCASCHSQKTARGSEHGSVRTDRPLQPRKGCDINGRPLDPNHPWNRDQ